MFCETLKCNTIEYFYFSSFNQTGKKKAMQKEEYGRWKYQKKAL